MIIFQTAHQELYNYVIHHLLKLAVYNGEEDVGDVIECFIPKYLYREQYLKCLKVMEELYLWSSDSFLHNMQAFHELLLYEFVMYMSAWQEEDDEFNSNCFDEKIHDLIKTAAQKDYEEFGREDGLKLDEIIEVFYCLSEYPDALFTDEDFLVIDRLYNCRKLGDTSIEERMGTNLDYYFELLPMDIQKQYKTNHITLTGDVYGLLKYIGNRVLYGSLYKLFWENDSPVKEDRIQVILENIMDAYFYNQEIEIMREALVGNGKVDFKLYKSAREDEKILIEIKRGSSSYLRKGYEKQLTEYMLSSKYKNSFYIIACFTDEEYERGVNFIRNHIYTDTIQLYINISILDLRKRKVPSNL